MEADDLRRLAKKTGFDVGTLEKDYALTGLLSGIYANDSNLKNVLIFKGGTAIRKVYFPEWRLSEDLDFTILEKVDADEIKKGFEEVFLQLRKRINIAYSFDKFRLGDFSILADVQFVGPFEHKNRIGHDIALREKLVEDPVQVEVKQEYEGIPGFKILVYSLNEILVEKIRSMFQRAKARDYYDAWRLVKDRKWELETIKTSVVKKCRETGVGFTPNLIFEETRLRDIKKFWAIALSRLTRPLPDVQLVIEELRSELDFLSTA